MVNGKWLQLPATADPQPSKIVSSIRAISFLFFVSDFSWPNQFDAITQRGIGFLESNSKEEI